VGRGEFWDDGPPSPLPGPSGPGRRAHNKNKCYERRVRVETGPTCGPEARGGSRGGDAGDEQSGVTVRTHIAPKRRVT